MSSTYKNEGSSFTRNKKKKLIFQYKINTNRTIKTTTYCSKNPIEREMLKPNMHIKEEEFKINFVIHKR